MCVCVCVCVCVHMHVNECVLNVMRETHYYSDKLVRAIHRHVDTEFLVCFLCQTYVTCSGGNSDGNCLETRLVGNLDACTHDRWFQESPSL